MSEFLRMPVDWHHILDAQLTSKITDKYLAKFIYSDIKQSIHKRILLEKIADICKIYKGRRLTDAVMVHVDNLALEDNNFVYIDGKYIAIRRKN